MGLDQYARAHLWAPPGRAEQQQSDVKIKVGLHALVSLFSAAPHLPKLESFCQEESPRTLWTPGLLLLSPSLCCSVSPTVKHLPIFRRGNRCSSCLLSFLIILLCYLQFCQSSFNVPCFQFSPSVLGFGG